MFDILTVAAIADELEGSVLDGRIQKIGLVDRTTFACEIYSQHRRRALIASADSQQPRILLTDAMPSIDPNLITPFGLQLRKYVRGGFLVGVEQPSIERMVRLSIVKRMPSHNGDRHDRRDRPGTAVHESEARLSDDAPVADIDESDEADHPDQLAMWATDMHRVEIIVEIMGRHSNIILVDDQQVVMESVKRVTSQMSRVRPVMPRLPYVLPPVPDKPDPRRLTTPGAEQLMVSGKQGAKLAELLVRGLRGVSPQIGREIAFRLTGDAAVQIQSLQSDGAVELARIVRNVFEPLLTLGWEPRVYMREDIPIGYAAIPMAHLAAISDERSVESMSEAVEAAMAVELGDAPRDHAQRRARLIDAIDRESAKVESRLRSLREQLKRAEHLEELRTWGELIYAYIWKITPGESEFEVDAVRIPLDPALTAKENAQECFEQYRKAQKAGASLPARVTDATHERDYLTQLRTQAQQSEGFAAIESLRQELDEHTGGRASTGERSGKISRKQQTKRPVAITDASGNAIYIGRTGRENDQVTFDIAGPGDLWMHARGVPGSHVIVRLARPDNAEDAEAMETAAALAAFYSSSRTSGTVDVDIAERRHVRKIKGAGPGMVTYRNERTVAVRPLDEAALKSAGRLS